MSKVILLQPPPQKFEDIQKTLFDEGAKCFLEKLHFKFDAKVDKLYEKRAEMNMYLNAGKKLTFHQTIERSDRSWNISKLPVRLHCRHLDLGDVSAANTAHFVAALNNDVQGVQVDFDDGHCPTWRNQLQAYHNIRLAVLGKLPGAPVNLATCPILMLRPRAFNIIDHNIMINGKEVAGPLVDFAIVMYHNATRLFQCGSGPFFYLSKVEGASEAALWNEIFIWAQNELDIPQGTIKACVLIENIVSTYELEEILFALKEHCMGLNCGIWDYSASIIAKFGRRKEFLLPDRNKYVSMEKQFLDSYMRLVVQTCHKRGALASGGMAATVLPPGAEGDESKAAIDKILVAKLREIEIGVDGFMVYDSRVVPHVNKLWRKYSPMPNQLTKLLDDKITEDELLKIPAGGVTLDGVKHNIAVAILFIYHWLAGTGHFFYDGNVEDSATAEISRWQVWQWIRFVCPLEDEPGSCVDVQLVEKLVNKFGAHAHKNLCRSNAERKRLTAAMYMCMEVLCSRHPPEYITTYLNDNHKFRTLHNKALLSGKSNL